MQSSAFISVHLVVVFIVVNSRINDAEEPLSINLFRLDFIRILLEIFVNFNENPEEGELFERVSG